MQVFFVYLLCWESGLFVIGEYRVVREDHGEILREINVEEDPVDIGDKIGRCHMENNP